MPTRPYVPRKLYQTNKSGHVGIYWQADINAYCVQRLVNGKRKTIGYRSSIEAAIALYNEPIQQQDSPGIIYTTATPPDFTAGFRQTLEWLLANNKHEEATLVQAALDRIQALKAAGANVK